MVVCQKFAQYIRMLCPGRFILVESVHGFISVFVTEVEAFCAQWEYTMSRPCGVFKNVIRTISVFWR